MSHLNVFILCAVIGSACADDDLKFPAEFRFGAASAAYQIEGAWNSSGKGESIWDRFAHSNSEYIEGHSNGDVACDSYNNWKRDVGLASTLGLHFYKFSISWSRLLPEGFPNKINKNGVNYYNNLINELIKNNIMPIVTLYHWDLPQKVHELGGWSNPYITDWFSDYARIVFNFYGDRVKTWITIDEPLIFCDMAYNTGRLAPGVKDPEIGSLLCNKHVLLAHAKAWRMYDKDFKSKFNGQVAIANHLIWHEGMDNNGNDDPLADLANEYVNGRYVHPVYSKEGGWPSQIRDSIRTYSKKLNLTQSKLPEFTEEEVDIVRGTYDFFALSYYQVVKVSNAPYSKSSMLAWPEVVPEIGVKFHHRPDYNSEISKKSEGLRKILNWVTRKYGDVNFFISGTGYGSRDNGQDDKIRLMYHRDHMEQVLYAIKKDGINVSSYTAWSLMDGFEGPQGYKMKYGLFKIDFSNPKRRATLRKSGLYYASVIANHSLDVSIELPNWQDNPLMISSESQSENYVVYTLILYLFFFTLFLSIVLSRYFMKNVRILH